MDGAGDAGRNLPGDDDGGMLEDLVAAAHDDAKAEAEEPGPCGKKSRT